MKYSQIVYEVKGSVALIILNRPSRLNAWTPRMCEEQADAIKRANEDSKIGSIIMTGAGRGFCSGADIEDTFQTRIDGEDPGNIQQCYNNAILLKTKQPFKLKIPDFSLLQ